MAKILLNVDVNSKTAQSSLAELQRSIEKLVAGLNTLSPNKDLTAQLNALARAYNAVNKAATEQASLDLKLAKLEADTVKAEAQRAKAVSDVATAAAKAGTAIKKEEEATERAKTAHTNAQTAIERLAIAQEKRLQNEEKTNQEAAKTLIKEEQLELQAAKTAAGVEKYGQAAEEAGEKTGFLGGSIGDTIAKFAKAEVAFLAVRTPLNLIKSALADVDDTLIKTENAVIELQRVLDETIPAGEISNRLYGLAQQYGQTFENVSTLAANFARSGRSWEESVQATEAALLAMNVAELNASQASEGLLSIMQQFKMEASEMTTVVDKLNKTADKNPVTTQKLLEAIKRAGSAAKNANISFDETLALITSISEATNRSGQNIGTAINSLIQYSQKKIDVFSSLSQESAEAVEKFKLGMISITDVWRQVAIDIHNDKESRDNIITALGTDDLEELTSSLHDELGDLVEEINGVYDVANTYRKNYFVALLDNMYDSEDGVSRFSKVLEGLQSVQNYSNEENAKYLETYDAKLNTLKAKWQELANDEQGILAFKKDLVDLGLLATEVIEQTGGIVDSLGTLASLIGGLALISGAEKLTQKVSTLGQTIITTITGAGTALQTTLGWVGLVLTSVSLVTTGVNTYKAAQKKARDETINLWKATEDNALSLEELRKKYDDLTPESEDYYKIEEQIVSLLSKDKKDALETVTKKTDEYREAVINLSNAELQAAKLKNYDALNAAKGNLESSFPLVTLKDDYFRAYLRSDTPDRSGQAVYKYSAEELYKEYQDFIAKFEALEKARADALAQGNKELADALKERYDGMKKAIDKYSTVMGDYGNVVDKQTFLDNYLVENIEETSEAIETHGGVGRTFVPATEEAVAATEDLTDAVNEAGDAADKASKRLDKYDDAIEYYLDVSNEIKERGIDVSQTIFGNIDTNNRQVLEWTEENIERFQDALKSWGMTAQKIEELSGELSTVFGASDWFGSEEHGMEIAFSPILQTPDGPILLDADTVRAYIEGILEEAGENPTKEKILRLDTQGIEQDGLIIRNLIAGIGDEAIKVGEAMHYSGTDGAFAQAFEGLKKHAEELGVSVEDLIKQYNLISREEIYDTFDKITESAENLETATKDLSAQIDEVQSSLSVLDAVQKEYDETGSISIDTLQRILDLGADYIDLLIDENGKINLNKQAVEDLKEEKKGLIDKLIEENTAQYALSLIQEIAAQKEHEVGKEAGNAALGVGTLVSQLMTLKGESGDAVNYLSDLRISLREIGEEMGVALTPEELDGVIAKSVTYYENLQNALSHTDTSTGWESSSSSSSKKEKDEYLESLKAAVSLRESELTLMQYQGASQDEQIAKIRQIQGALNEEANYLRSIGVSQEDINKLSSEWWKYQEKINKFAEDNAKAAEKAAQEQKKAAEEAEKAAKKAEEEAKKAAEEAEKARIKALNDETARHKQVVSDLKAELNLWQKQGKSVSDQVDEMKRIQDALHEEAEWLRHLQATQEDIKVTQAEIDALSVEWWDWQEKILKTYQDILDAARDLELEEQQKIIDSILKEVDLKEDELRLSEKQLAVTEAQANLENAIVQARLDYVRTVLSEYITSLSDAKTLEEKQAAVISAREKLATAEREAQAKAIIDSFKSEREGKSDLLSLEEKRLAVEKARQALLDAENERTTRFYNEATGQWEYGSDAKAVQSAQDNLKSAVDALNEFVEEAAWNEVAEAVENGSVTEAEVRDILEKWAKESYGEGSPEFIQKITSAFRKAMGTAVNPDSVSGQISAVDSAVESLNDYLKQEAVKELEKYIADGNTDASGMRAILNRWLSMGEGGELYEWRDGLLSTLGDAIRSGYYDDSKVDSSVRAVESAVESLHDYIRSYFISEVSDLVRNGTAEQLRDFIDQQSKLYDDDDIPREWANRLYDSKSKYESIESDYASVMNASRTDAQTQAILERMKANSAAWWTASEEEKKRLSELNYVLGTSLGLHRGDDGAWYSSDGMRVYDDGGVLNGIGGIKATRKPEIILDPSLTEKILRPQSEAAFRAFTDAMNVMVERGGRTASGGWSRNGFSDSHNVSNVINGIPISPAMAETHTIAELCRLLPITGRA